VNNVKLFSGLLVMGIYYYIIMIIYLNNSTGSLNQHISSQVYELLKMEHFNSQCPVLRH